MKNAIGIRMNVTLYQENVGMNEAEVAERRR